MKNLLYILLFVPLALFGQDLDCLNLTDDYIEINIGDIGASSIQCSTISVSDNYLINFVVTDSISFSIFPSLRSCAGSCADDGGCHGYMEALLSLVKNGECQESSQISASYGQECWIGTSNTSFIFKEYNLLAGSYSIFINGNNYDGNESNNEIEFAVNYIGAIPNPMFGFSSPYYEEFYNTYFPALGVCSDFSVCTDQDALNYEPLVGNYIINAIVDNTSCEYDIITQLNQSFDVWNISINLDEGWNMFGYGCPNPIDMVEGLSNHTENIAIVKNNNGSVYMPEFGFNGIGNFTSGYGYQIKVTEPIEGFSLCDWYVNDIPVDNIVSLQEKNVILQDSIDVLNNTSYTPLYQIDDMVQGGIVFYVDATGQHGLVAALEDLEGTFEWGCFEEYVDGADSKWIGSGLQNTMDITNQGCATEDGGITAAQAALDAEINGYSDWHLPSSGELYQMYITIGQGSENGNLGGFENIWYWSSSENVPTNSFYVNFNNGVTNTIYKAIPTSVRVIRSF